MRFEIAGLTGLEVRTAPDSAIAAFLRSEMDPYRPLPRFTEETRAQPADVVVAPVLATSTGFTSRGQPSFSNLQNDAGDELVTAWDGERAFVCKQDRWCSLPDAFAPGPATFEFEAGFPIWDIWGSLVRPVLSLASLRHEAVVVHASAVEIDGQAVLVAGWSESGKTEVALALAEMGARFISDKWSVVRPDCKVAPFPISVGLRRWAVPHFPALESRLPAMARVQFAGAAAASTLLPSGRRRSSARLLREAANLSGRFTALADRVAMPSSAIRRVYGGHLDEQCQPVPISTVVMLTTVSDPRPEIGSIAPDVAARRLALTAEYERRAYFSIGERVAYAGAGQRRCDAAEAAAIEAALLRPQLEAVRLLELRTCFPSDPSILARSIREAGI
jgi:hypothetical protein